MDREILSKYNLFKLELLDIEKRIKRLEIKEQELETVLVSDSVEGTRKDGTFGSIRIEGLSITELDRIQSRLRRLRERYAIQKQKNEEMILQVEEYIASLPDTQIRLILRKRYIENLSWEQIGRQFGKTPSWGRVLVERFFKKSS
jgi:hypothetical protein|nr:MAG TPA: Protein of unknown function (DUF722) [Caudoviricetes sp.]